MDLRSLIARWRAGRRERLAGAYGSMSAEERAELEQLRSEHNPFRGLGRGRGGGSTRPGPPTRFDDALKPPRDW